MIYPRLYQIDQKDKLRFWCMETDEAGQHRTISGIEGGKETVSGWTICEATNVGRSNERAVDIQAAFEVEAEYTKKLDRKYYKSAEEARTAGTGSKFLQPMLAGKWEDCKDKIDIDEGFFIQPKLDGVRCLVNKSGMWSRQGKPIFGAPHIRACLEQFFEWHPDVTLDGELYNHDLKHNFDKLVSLIKKQKPTPDQLEESEDKVQFHIYDVITHGNFDERYDFITENVDRHFHLHHVHTEWVTDYQTMDMYYGHWLELGYEGQMIRLETEYEHKRSKNLLKRKEFLDEEFPIVRLEEGLGNWAGAVKKAVLTLPDGREFEAGVRGTMELLRIMLDKYNAGIGPKQATVRFQNYTPDGIPRFGVVTAFHDGEREL